VLGTTRATLLAQLDLPMSTTQIAGQLALSAPSVSAHLRALHRAGILAARRDGRAVLYTRTGLGEQLVAARSAEGAD
jgi:DNA-binding transcriptional ArsR family regulator